MSKKSILIILLLISCSIGVIAQSDYYYYNGKKIPLTIDDSKICVSISKVCEKTSKKILANVEILERISDDIFDIFAISQLEYKKLADLDSWREDLKSVILTPCYRTADYAEIFTSPYLNVQLKKEQDITLLSLYAQKYKLEIIKQDPLMPLWYIVSISPETGMSTLEIANVLWESGKFAASVPDFCSNDLTCSNDPYFDYQWGLNNNCNHMDISACAAWNYSTGNNVKIAILDQGVDMNHIDLASNVSDMSYDTETNSSPSVVYGFHGTHCAGIAAAIKDNGIQIAGVAPEATIVSISNSLDGTTNSRLKRADGIIWAYQHGIDIISNSWRSTTYHSAIDQAILDAFRYGRQGKGCVITFAAGNNGSNSISYPANCNDTILAVGSIDSTGTKAPHSNYGEKLDLVAPGVDILSTLPNDTIGYNGGTSMACPHVAGVAALILERNPELSVTQVNSIICSNAKKITATYGTIKPDGTWNNKYGYGLVNAYGSVINTPHLNTVYIQNDTITGTEEISAYRIYVGRDVTNRIEHGDVILGQGNITLKAKSVIIKNSTTIPLGTKLKIGNQ